MDKREKQSLNAIAKAKEFYHLVISKEEYESLCKQIQNSEALFVERQSRRVTKWLVKINRSWYPVVYDKVRNSIVTFLNPLYLGRHLPLANYVTHRIVSVSQYQAENIIKEPGYRHALAGLVSIGDPGKPELKGFSELEIPKIRLNFHDINHHSLVDVQPKRSHVEEIIAFGRKTLNNLPNNKFVLVHCQAGIGRSTATALVLRAILFPNLSPNEIAKGLMNENPRAMPNISIVKWGDHLLEYQGELKAAADIVNRFYWYSDS